LRGLKREHVESFIADQLDRWKPSTANNRYRGLQAFFRWVLAEDELDANLMSGMEPPKIPEEPPPVLGEDELRRLLKACDGKDFAARRDEAIVRLVLDTGKRQAECPAIMLADLALMSRS
jgi:integrase/recombinase XerC